MDHFLLRFSLFKCIVSFGLYVRILNVTCDTLHCNLNPLFAHLGKFSLTFSCLWFVIGVNLLHV